MEMNRRRMLHSLTCAAAIATASPAFAITFAEDVVAQLSSLGFSGITAETTWLGRVRILAHRNGGLREIVLNPRTGEILRDSFVPAAGQGGYRTVLDDVDDRQGGKSGSGGTEPGSSGGGSGSGGSGGSGGGGSGSGSGGGSGSSGGSGSGGGSGSNGSGSSGSGGGDDDDNSGSGSDDDDKSGSGRDDRDDGDDRSGKGGGDRDDGNGGKGRD
jgi:hypothetical protein